MKNPYNGNFGVGFDGKMMLQQRTEFMHFARLQDHIESLNGLVGSYKQLN
jgi:hypothetical protein